LSIINRRYVLGKMLFDPDTNTYFDLKDGQLLAMTTEQENKTPSVFHDLFVIELEKSTLTIKEITNESWPDTTKQTGVFYLEQKSREKKGLSFTKKDFGKLLATFKELSEK